MKFRPLATAFALVSAFGASAIGAQVPGAAAKAAAQHAADAANAQLSQQTGQAVPQRTTASPSDADIAARLKSMKSQNVAPIKTGSAQQPAQQQAAAQQPAAQQPAPQKSAAAIPKTRTVVRSQLTGAPAAPARSSNIQQHVSGAPDAPPPSTPAAPAKAVEQTPSKSAAATKPVEQTPSKNVATTKPVEAAPTKPAPTSKSVEAPIKPGTESVPTKNAADTSVSQQGNPAAMAKGANAPGPKGRDSVLVMREQFAYDRDGRRDPFVSLMTTTDLRPTISDLRLTSVLYDQSGRRPVAIMRDSIAGVQWRVTTGMTLGRMRVSSIRPRVVVFTIEEFGFSRQDSLMLRDTTRVRSK
jgi:hypothetical protein